MAYLSLGPVSAAIFTALNVPAFLALCAGGAHDAIPQQTVFPMLLFVVSETAQVGGLGTKPGHGRAPEVTIRFHVYSQYEGLKECQAILAKAIELLVEPPAVTGYSSWAIFHDEPIPVGAEVVAGIEVQELTHRMRLYVEEAA